MDRLLKVGDVFRVEEGMTIFTDVPEKFTYYNKAFSTKNVEHNVDVGYTLKTTQSQIDSNLTDTLDAVLKTLKDRDINVSVDVIRDIIVSSCVDSMAPDKFETGSFIGEYVVIKTETKEFTRGNGYDCAPSEEKGHKVTAKKLLNRVWDPNGVTISFYQTGPLLGITKKESVRLIKTMEMSFR